MQSFYKDLETLISLQDSSLIEGYSIKEVKTFNNDSVSAVIFRAGKPIATLNIAKIPEVYLISNTLIELLKTNKPRPRFKF